MMSQAGLTVLAYLMIKWSWWWRW